jgi:hypothetical protein
MYSISRPAHAAGLVKDRPSTSAPVAAAPLSRLTPPGPSAAPSAPLVPAPFPPAQPPRRLSTRRNITNSGKEIKSDEEDQRVRTHKPSLSPPAAAPLNNFLSLSCSPPLPPSNPQLYLPTYSPLPQPTFIEMSKMQSLDPRGRKPLERSVSLAFEDAIFAKDGEENFVNEPQMQFWFNEPEGGWNQEKIRLQFAKELPEEHLDALWPK